MPLAPLLFGRTRQTRQGGAPRTSFMRPRSVTKAVTYLRCTLSKAGLRPRPPGGASGQTSAGARCSTVSSTASRTTFSVWVAQ